MKKLLSLMLSVLMVMSVSVPAALVVSADDATSVDSSLVFSLDLSDGTVKNGVSGNSSTVTAGSGNTIGTVERMGTKYLDIGASASTAGIEVADSAINAAASDAITLEWWARADSATPSGWMASLRNDSTGKYSLKAQSINSGGVIWRIDTEYVDDTSAGKWTGYQLLNTDYSAYDEWTHFAVTRSYDTTASKGTIKVYVNGKHLGDAEFSGTQYEMQKLYIGKAHSSAAAFAGDIGAFNVYNTVLDGTAIKAKYDASVTDYYYTDPSGLIFSMDLSDSTDSTVVVKDAAEDLVTETITVGANNTIGEIAGTGKKYLQLAASGATGVLVTDSDVNTATTSAITYELWSKASDDTSNSGWILGHRNGSGKYAMKAMHINNSINQLGFEMEDTVKARVTQVDVDHTSWTHWVITKSYNSTSGSGEITVYQNGEKVVSKGFTNPTSFTAASLSDFTNATLGIGKAYGDSTAAFTNGAIGTCNVYSKVLSAADAKARFDASVGDYYVLDKTGLVFDMDLSGYDADSTDSAKGIVDRAGDMTTETLELASSAEVAPISEGSSVKALNLVASTKAGLKVLDADVDAAASSEAMTVEAWMNITSSGGHALLYTNASAAHNWQIMNDRISNESLVVINRLHNNTSAQTTNDGITYGQWAHYVYTREYDTDAQTCTLSLYVNGEQIYSEPVNSGAPQTMTDGIMHIGGGTYNAGAVAMNGSMATFKVYNRALNQNEAYSKYCIDAYKFGIEVDTEVMIGGTGIQWHTGNTPITAINANVESVEVDFSIQNNTNESKNVFCILAMYEDDKTLVKCDVSEAVTVSGYGTGDFSLALEDITPSEGCYAKIFVWQGGTLKPFIDADNIINYSEVCLQ